MQKNLDSSALHSRGETFEARQKAAEGVVQTRPQLVTVVDSIQNQTHIPSIRQKKVIWQICWLWLPQRHIPTYGPLPESQDAFE